MRPTEKYDLLKGVIAIAVIVCLFFGLIQLAYYIGGKHEIDTYDYKEITSWIKSHPELEDPVDYMMADGLITVDEYREILRLKWGLENRKAKQEMLSE